MALSAAFYEFLASVDDEPRRERAWVETAAESFTATSFDHCVELLHYAFACMHQANGIACRTDLIGMSVAHLVYADTVLPTQKSWYVRVLDAANQRYMSAFLRLGVRAFVIVLHCLRLGQALAETPGHASGQMSDTSSLRCLLNTVKNEEVQTAMQEMMAAKEAQ